MVRIQAMTDIDTSNLVVWPKWCYSNNSMESDSQDLVLNNNNSKTSNNNNVSFSKERQRKKLRLESLQELISEGGARATTTTMQSGDGGGGDVKAERLSPAEGSTETTCRHESPSPSTSPKSPVSSLRTRTPSFAGTPPHPAFTPPSSVFHSPYDRFSPIGQGSHGAIKQMENLMTRNCSDLMRSLAAKYNNTNPNDYFSTPSNGFLRSPMQSLKGGPSPFFGLTSPSGGGGGGRGDSDKKSENSPTISPVLSSQSLPHPGTSPIFSNSTTNIAGFPGFPLVDMSSTQVLLNMVRNASAAQQSQLENYLKVTAKRPAENSSSPLDLSSSVAAKRPRTELPRSFDVKSLFLIPSTEEEKKQPESTNTHTLLTSSSTKIRTASSPKSSANTIPCSDKNCPTLEGVSHWTVEDVCNFVGSIDLCIEYVEAFREQCIDGATLPLLTEEHLTSSINMKLGPALKLRSVLAKKLGSCNICLHCNHCHSSLQLDRRPNSVNSSGQ